MSTSSADNTDSLLSRLNRARHMNNMATLNDKSSIKKPQKSQDDHLLSKNNVKMDKTIDVTSTDHLKDPDIQKYVKQLKDIPKNDKNKDSVDETDVNRISERFIKKVERSKQRNLRAADYDISGKYHVDFINDNNKRFNKKLARAYNEYTEDLRLNLERGSNI